MPAKLCPKHGKPFPCGKCRIENAQKPAQTPPASTGAVAEQEPAILAPVPSIDTNMQLQSQYRQSVLREQVKCRHGNSPLYCVWCERVVTPETEAATVLQRQLGLSTPALETQILEARDPETYIEFFPEI